MSTSATTRRARIGALALAVTMVLTLAGGALLGSGGTDPAPAPPTPATEPVVDLTDLSEEELAALLAEYGAAPTTAPAGTAEAPTP